jgi:hypothetical protein
MNTEQIMALVAAELDACLKAIIDSAENVVRNHGGTEDEIAQMRMQVRMWILQGLRSGKTLN